MLNHHTPHLFSPHVHIHDMEQQKANVYDTVNPVYGVKSTPNTNNKDKKQKWSHSDKALVSLVVATSFSILLALSSLIIAVFVLANQMNPADAPTNAGGDNQGNQMLQGVTGVSNESLGMMINKLTEEVNRTQTQINVLGDDVTLTKNQIQILSDNASITREQIKALKADTDATKSRVQMLSIVDIDGLQEALNSIIQDINTTNVQVSLLSQDVTLTKSQLQQLSETASFTTIQVQELEQDTSEAQLQVKLLSENVSGLATAQSSFTALVIEINRTMDEVVTGPPGKDSDLKKYSTDLYYC